MQQSPDLARRGEAEGLSRSSLGPPEVGRAHRSLDVGDRGGAHRELADAEADQQERRTRVARELAADVGPDATRVPGGGRAADQLQDGRMERVRDLRDPLVPAIGGQRVHREVVGADREEVDLPGKTVGQLRIHAPARSYMEKKRAEGKTKTQALRGLKRLITRSVFRTMTSIDQPTDRLTAVAA